MPPNIDNASMPMRARRRLLLFLAALSVAVAVLQHVAGGLDLVLAVSPALLIFGILVSGWLPGEKWIVARHATRRPQRRARRQPHWTRQRERALVSLIERIPAQLRGLPSATAAHC
jgi:hypothetical protein